MPSSGGPRRVSTTMVSRRRTLVDQLEEKLEVLTGGSQGRTLREELRPKSRFSTQVLSKFQKKFVLVWRFSLFSPLLILSCSFCLFVFNVADVGKKTLAAAATSLPQVVNPTNIASANFNINAGMHKEKQAKGYNEGSYVLVVFLVSGLDRAIHYSTPPTTTSGVLVVGVALVVPMLVGKPYMVFF